VDATIVAGRVPTDGAPLAALGDGAADVQPTTRKTAPRIPSERVTAFTVALAWTLLLRVNRVNGTPSFRPLRR
jgi:hypothetical protein